MQKMSKQRAKQILTAWLESSKGTEEQLGYIEGWFNKEDEEAFCMAIEALTDVVNEDGTLTVHVSDGSKVGRVLVLGDDRCGGLYYADDDDN